jgi:hypothetical protein
VATTNCCLPFSVVWYLPKFVDVLLFYFDELNHEYLKFFSVLSLFLIQDFFQHTPVTSIVGSFANMLPFRQTFDFPLSFSFTVEAANSHFVFLGISPKICWNIIFRF